jgi:LuxR family maltose regulon positive regulatory protein
MPRRTSPSQPQSLIATKTIPAQFDARFVSRAALFERFLSQGGQGGVASIVATAGSGKSVLMAELNAILVDRGGKTCWLSLEQDDDSCAVVSAYLLSALHAVEPAWVAQELALIRGNPHHDIQEVLDQLVGTLSGITTPLTLFFDDFHHLRSPELLAFFNKMVSHMPACMRMVVASRSQLPLALGRLRLRGRLFELEQQALGFDVATTGQVLRQVHGLNLAAGDLQALQATTEGWASGVQLAALALHRHRGRHRDLIDSFSGRDQGLASYLVESVLRSQPQPVRDFLLLTAPLRRMSADLCNAVTGQSDGAAMLDQVGRCNLFLIALDSSGRWFRYHHLFAECLTDELRRTDPVRFRPLWVSAARWCEHEGHTTEAIQYHLDSEDFEQACRLIAEHALPLAQRDGDHYTVLDWMRRLPAAYRDSRPEILLSHAWSLAFSQNSYKAMALCNRVVAMLRDDEDADWQPGQKLNLRLTAQVTQAVAEATADQLDTCIARATELRDKIPAHEGFLLAATSNCLSYCHFARADFDKSASAAADAYVFGRRVGADFATAWADFIHGLADLGRGRLRSAQEHSTRVSATANRRGVAQSYSAGLAALLNAEISRQRGAFDDAGSHLEPARYFSGVFGALEPLLLAIRNEAAPLAHAGRSDEARSVLMAGQDLALRLDLPRLYGHLAIDEVVLRLHGGDTAGAFESAQRTRVHDPQGSAAPLVTGRAWSQSLQLLQARLLLAEGHAAGALRLLNLLQNAQGSDRRSGLALTVTAVKAVALWQCEQHKEAMRELDSALTQAAPERHAFPILDAGPGLLLVLRGVAERRELPPAPNQWLAKDQLRQCLADLLSGSAAGLGAAPARHAEVSGPQEPITERETQLLRLVDAGLGNKQLAEALLISEGTVKWHLHNVYSKLGVRSRSAATAKARALRMI